MVGVQNVLSGSRVNVDIKSKKSITCHQNRVLNALMSGAYDAWAIHAALLHGKADLVNVNLYIILR